MSVLTFNTNPSFEQQARKETDGTLTKIYPVTDARITKLDITSAGLADHTDETTVQKSIEGLNSRVDAMGNPDQFEKIVNAESEIEAPLKKGHYFVIGTGGTYYDHILEKDDRLYVARNVDTGATPVKDDFQAIQGNMLAQHRVFATAPVDTDDIADLAEHGIAYIQVDEDTADMKTAANSSN